MSVPRMQTVPGAEVGAEEYEVLVDNVEGRREELVVGVYEYTMFRMPHPSTYW